MTRNKRRATMIAQTHDDETKPRSLVPPIHQTATYYFNTLQEVQKAFDFESRDYVYTRGNNPTLRLLEEKITALENGTDGVAFASGMAAISSVLLSLVKPGDEVLFHRTLYGSTYSVGKVLLPRYGVKTHFADLNLLRDEDMAAYSRVKVIYFETPVNPNLEIIDIKKMVALSELVGAKVVVDNTFLTPYFQNPLDLGAYAVVHSSTKYLNGHGDVVAGLAVSRDQDYIHRLKFDYMAELGGVLSPFNAWLVLRGIKTLHLRMERHQANALAVVAFLKEHPQVTKVFYPGLTSPLIGGQMRGTGGMIAFELEGSVARSMAVVEALKCFRLAVSLGDIESLVEMPAKMTHYGYDKASLEAFGLSEKMIRLSIGLEDALDLVEDLSEAIGAHR
ncbi:MAG: methionine gamma-lyase [delta proteobacterium ML8_F1]|nr:MAG: methionine gamma-lyase [delta proteobacterium ML8_F1]